MSETQLATRQIADGAITNAKVAAGAAIASSKLADGANFVNKDGSVAFTGNQSLGGNKLTNLGTPSAASNDSARMVDVENAIAALNSLFSSKQGCRAASTANVTVSNPGTSTFDGVSLSNGDRLLLKSQTAGAENGIYVFNGSGSALTRATDMDAWAEVPGALVVIQEGTANADTIWLCTSNAGGTLDSTAIAWQQIGVSTGLSSSNFVDKEVPSGSINGSNATFTLANTPTAGSEHVFLNGVLQQSGSGNDFTISGAVITYLTAPLTGDKLVVSYRK